MKKLLIITLILALLLCACGSRTSQPPEPQMPDWLEKQPEPEPAPEAEEPEPEPEPAPEATPEPTPEAVQPTPAPAPAPAPDPTPAVQGLDTVQGRYTMNIFLSNFSEQGFHLGYAWPCEQGSTFYSSDADSMELVSFCWINAKINETLPDLVEYEGNHYYAIDLGMIDSLAWRYFGRSISAGDIRPVDMYDMPGYFLLDGQVCLPAADGDTYNALSIANSMTSLGDGLYQVDFGVYYAEIGDGGIVDVGGPITDKSVYELTAQQAADHWALTYAYSGTAVVRQYITPGGTNTFQLVSYTAYN